MLNDGWLAHNSSSFRFSPRVEGGGLQVDLGNNDASKGESEDDVGEKQPEHLVRSD